MLCLCQKDLNVFDHFGQKTPRADPSRIHRTSEIFFQNIGFILLHLRNLQNNCFEKKSSRIRRKINGQPSPLVSPMKGLTAFFNHKKALWWIIWFCKQKDHFCFQNNAVGLCTSTWRKFFLVNEGVSMAKYLVNISVTKFLVHTLR